MKLLSIIFGFSLLIITATCNTQSQNSAQMEITGIIQPIEMSSWQYGTHTIRDKAENFYALRSKTIALEKFEGKVVIIKALKVEGYPVDGGPDFYEVQSLKEQ